MIEYIINDSSKKIDHSIIKRIGENLETENNKLNIELNFISREEIRKLNLKYLKKNKPTDVLSFNSTGDVIVGQIFICYDIAVEQAKEYNWTLENEVALLVIHGTLHILGWDHENMNDARKMIEKENEILNTLNLKEYDAEA
ncbi:rRNA maturation RNase YbeY [bacterium CG2_30_37_16]|nr:MAG: rRNA maturation RNase YbeY [bacterium CG2_30_37_16]PIP30243.1 MAG: rRNA maturation RNase YbeY [bacterium (Candidatus Howlettbacteria) CG23_combo_of_CG06-09_8_20_14_all_37_9]PIX98939.1 MAG: rRNA maturation RNase YbeY [bacterium (Candidatus Howlettbacteria) CG_4_10_14_3_um_filter_37_10]PJB07227.1 MAG: rRNA maturation RNase YbeY [bacterium (Candidatus Howlettbacteria) CG_4_9_14_3_um_filter_37_10]